MKNSPRIFFLNPKVVSKDAWGASKLVDACGQTPDAFEVGDAAESFDAIPVIAKSSYDLVCAHNTILQAEIDSLKNRARTATEEVARRFSGMTE